MSADHLVRLRADPRKIRVGVRRHGDGWRVTLEDRAGYYLVHGDTEHAENLPRLIDHLIDRAQNWPGVDRDMQWVFRHPQAPR